MVCRSPGRIASAVCWYRGRIPAPLATLAEGGDGDGFALDGHGPAILIGSQVGDGRLDLADEAGIEEALLHLLAGEALAAVGRIGGGLVGKPMPLQGIADHII